MKLFTRMCREYYTTFGGYHVPVGAIYGRDHSRLFICNDYAGINTGHLNILVCEKSGRWAEVRVDKNAWQFKAVVRTIRAENNGKIPRITTWKNPGGIGGQVVGQPHARIVNYRFTPSGQSVGSLIRQSHDNADHSGGGSNIRNYDSYWAIYKDMDRRCV